MASPGAAPLGGTKVVVIGAGMIGSTLAFRLAQAGAQVTVVERRFPGSGTSSRSFAWVNSIKKTPPAYGLLNERSIHDHVALRDELAGDWLHLDGGLVWAEADDAKTGLTLRAAIDELRERRQRVDRLEPADVSALEPDIVVDPDRVAEVFRIELEGWVSAMLMIPGVLRAAVRHGARVVAGTVTGLRRSGETVHGVELDPGDPIDADVVVNAAGPDAATISALAGLSLPLRREPGLMAVTAPAPVGVKHVVHAPRVHVRGDGGGRLFIRDKGIDEHGDLGHPRLDDPAVTTMIESARGLFRGARGIEVEAVRVGVRPIPVDDVPIVGFASQAPGLYTLVTHSGVTLAPRLATLVTADLAGGSPAELEPYRASRFEPITVDP